MMSSEFEDHLDTYGGDLGRWPGKLRAEADALLSVSPEARAAKRAMDLVEQILGEAPAAAPASASAIAARAMRSPQIGRTTQVGRAPARPRSWTRITAFGAATAAALVLGIAVGNMHLDTHEDNPDQILASALDQGSAVDVD